MRRSNNDNLLLTSDSWNFTFGDDLSITLPEQLTPTNGATNISTNISQELSWLLAQWNDITNFTPISYDLYFGENSSPALNQNIPAGNTQPVTNITADPNTTYYWKVVAKNGNTVLGETPIWSFTTEAGGGGNGNYPGQTVFVQGGTFSMGSTTGDSDESPVHSVTLSDFNIGKYEVTNAEYAAFLNVINAPADGSIGGIEYIDLNVSSCQISYTGSVFEVDLGKENYPVIQVSWDGANAYATWVGGSLPTEAQWEYAARGGNQSQSNTYSGSNIIDNVAWYYDNSPIETKSIGTKSANELGIHDMSGNAFEWCLDWYSDTYYNMSPNFNPTGPSTGFLHVLRGGNVDSGAYICRSTNRAEFAYSVAGINGFRVVF